MLIYETDRLLTLLSKFPDDIQKLAKDKANNVIDKAQSLQLQLSHDDIREAWANGLLDVLSKHLSSVSLRMEYLNVLPMLQEDHL